MSQVTPSYKSLVRDGLSSVKLDNIRPLAGEHNYRTWAATMVIIWKSMQVCNIVVAGDKPTAGAAQEELDAYDYICNYVATIYLQVVSPDIWERIVEIGHPHDMWTFLQAEYHHPVTPFALVSQISSVSSLSTSYERSVSMASFISKFEAEWQRLTELAKASSASYHQLFTRFLLEDKAKRDFLLGFLVNHEKDMVCDLSAKDGLTFSEVKQRLRGLDAERQQTRSAYSKANRKKKTQPTKTFRL